MRNVILTDVDGCMLNWEDTFETWMRFNKGIKRISYHEFDHYGFSISNSFGVTPEEAIRFIEEFNTSEWMRSLPPVRDAVKYVRKLHEEHGYVFHVITSFGTDVQAQKWRLQNLQTLFGMTAIQRFVPLSHNVSKEETLAPYGGQGLLFVEDRKFNVDLALSLNIEGVLMHHEYNADYEGAGTRVVNWKEIYHYIVDNEDPSYYVEQRRIAHQKAMREFPDG